MTESEKSTLKNQASTIQNEVNEGSNTAQRVGQMFNRVIDAVPITTQEVTEESTTVPSNSAVGKKFENSFNERITSSLTEDTNKVPSNKAVYDFINKRIVGEIALEDLDKLSTSATTYFVGTAPVFLIVKKGTIIVGILQVFTDDMRHVVTQVFTTHYALVNGSFGSAHIDTKVFTYYRSYSISSPNIPTGTWSAWKKTEEAFTGFFECSTPATTGTKTITINGFTLDTNCRLVVKMTNSNTAANATLNINSTGAIPLFYNGERASASNYWEAGEVLDIYYDGTNFQASNIQGGAGEGGNMILTFTTDVATTRKSVKDKFRRAGLVIAYKNASGEWVNEQYIGTTFTDAQWQLDSNWQKIASNKDVTDGIKGAITSTITDDEGKAPSNKAVKEALNPLNKISEEISPLFGIEKDLYPEAEIHQNSQYDSVLNLISDKSNYLAVKVDVSAYKGGMIKSFTGYGGYRGFILDDGSVYSVAPNSTSNPYIVENIPIPLVAKYFCYCIYTNAIKEGNRYFNIHLKGKLDSIIETSEEARPVIEEVAGIDKTLPHYLRYGSRQYDESLKMVSATNVYVATSYDVSKYQGATLEFFSSGYSGFILADGSAFVPKDQGTSSIKKEWTVPANAKLLCVTFHLTLTPDQSVKVLKPSMAKRIEQTEETMKAQSEDVTNQLERFRDSIFTNIYAGKKLLTFGDSLFQNGSNIENAYMWKRFTSIMKMEWSEEENWSTSKGGTKTLEANANCGMMRVRKAVEGGYLADIIFYENVNDTFVPEGTRSDVPFMLRELMSPWASGKTSAEEAKAAFKENFSTLIKSYTPKVGSLIPVAYTSSSGSILTVSSSAIRNQTIIIGNDTFKVSVEITTADTVESIIRKIYEFDVTLSPKEFYDSSHIHYSGRAITVQGTGISVTTGTINSTSSGFCFCSYDLAEWQDLSKWKDLSEMTKWSLYKGLIEYISKQYPLAKLFWVALESPIPNSPWRYRADGSVDYDRMMADFGSSGLGRYNKHNLIIEEICAYYNIPVLDVFRNQGINLVNVYDEDKDKTFAGSSMDVHLEGTYNGADRWAETMARLML